MIVSEVIKFLIVEDYGITIYKDCTNDSYYFTIENEDKYYKSDNIKSEEDALSKSTELITSGKIKSLLISRIKSNIKTYLFNITIICILIYLILKWGF